MRTHFADAVSYWERRRIAYNGVLAVLVLICWSEPLPRGPWQWLGTAIVLAAFAAIANALYCMAYPVDLALQFTPLKEKWLRSRWILFATGLVIACALALNVMLNPGMG